MSKLDKVSDEVMELSLDEKEILAQIGGNIGFVQPSATYIETIDI